MRRDVRGGRCEGRTDMAEEERRGGRGYVRGDVSGEEPSERRLSREVQRWYVSF